MTESTTESIKYAIRLPNGKLVRDLPDPVIGSPQYRTFPDQVTRAYLWDQHDDAVRTIDAISKENTQWGMSHLFVQHSDVVRVRISFEILDSSEATDAPVVTEPRSWAHAEQVPEGVTVRIDGIDDGYTYTRRGAYFETDPVRNISGCLSVLQVSRAATGYYLVEVLP